MRMAMKEVRDATAQILDSTTLADVLKRVGTAISRIERKRARRVLPVNLFT